MIKPKALKQNDTIGLVAPARASKDAESVQNIIKMLQELGYNVKAGKSCFEKHGYLAGSDEVRANDINEMFADRSIDAVFCLMGGYGAPRLLDRLDYVTIKNNPKLFVGYSDITALHTAINQKCGLVTIHGPMPMSDTSAYHSELFSKESLFSCITNIAENKHTGVVNNPTDEKICSLNGGKSSGILTGGNLTLITSMLGTPYEIDTKEKILFLEDIGEHTYRVDRMLTQLRLAGKLDDCSGIVLGSFRGCDKEYEDCLSLEQVFDDIIKPCGKPVITNLRAGHCHPKITLPLGVAATLDADNCILEITESCLSA